MSPRHTGEGGGGKRILVLWADDASTNLGVRALGRGSAALAQRVWPGAEIVFQNYGTRVPELPFGTIRSLARERATGQLGMMNWLADFDLAIDTGSGDSFTDIYGLRRLVVRSTVAELTRQAGVPVILGPQTIGPFDTRLGRTVARRLLQSADLVMSRDQQSSEAASALGRPVDVDTTDVVFALPPAHPTVSRDVLLNISGLLWRDNPHVPSKAYRETVTSLYRRLVADGRDVSLLAHVIESPDHDNDVPALREFSAAVAPSAELVIPTSLDDVRSATAGANLVIASRMHACLNAVSQGTPAVALAYSRKFEPLLARLGWMSTVDLRDASDHVSQAMALVTSPGLDDEVAGVQERAHQQVAIAESALRSVVA